MTNSNYNLDLTATFTYTNLEGEEFIKDVSFDPYEITSMEDLREFCMEELGIDTNDIMIDDGIILCSVEITDFDEVPNKFANEKDVFDFAADFAECTQEIEVVEAALEAGISASDIDESYSGKYNDDEDFAMDIAEQTGSYDRDAPWPMSCIDWSQAAKELMYDYVESNGYYFRML